MNLISFHQLQKKRVCFSSLLLSFFQIPFVSFPIHIEVRITGILGIEPGSPISILLYRPTRRNRVPGGPLPEPVPAIRNPARLVIRRQFDLF